MNVPLPEQQDLQHLLTSQEDKYLALESLREKASYLLPEVQYEDKDNSLRLYASLCANLSAQLGQYMRLRRLILLPYINDLFDKEEDGHDCRACGGGCSVRHASHIISIREAHSGLHELLEHLQPVAAALHSGPQNFPDVFRDLRAEMMQLEQTLNEVLFIEASALVPMMVDLQRNIGAHE